MTALKREDARSLYCRRLGHQVTFRYCRVQEGHTVCAQMLNCWWQTFDIESYVRKCLGAEVLAQLSSPAPAPRVASIVELAARARAAAADTPAQDQEET